LTGAGVLLTMSDGTHVMQMVLQPIEAEALTLAGLARRVDTVAAAKDTLN
jgi:hypothetical protein